MGRASKQKVVENLRITSNPDQACFIARAAASGTIPWESDFCAFGWMFTHTSYRYIPLKN